MSRFIHFEFAVYLPAAPSAVRLQPMPALMESLRDDPGLKLVDNLPKQPQTMLVRAHLNESVKDSYAPPLYVRFSIRVMASAAIRPKRFRTPPGR